MQKSQKNGQFKQKELRAAIQEAAPGGAAQYATISDLEGLLTHEEIKLRQIGELHKRLIALLDDQVEAASLVGPRSDIGKALG